MQKMHINQILKKVHVFHLFYQEDEDLLQKGKLTDAVRLCVQLRCCEKKILGRVKDFSAGRIQKLQPDAAAT